MTTFPDLNPFAGVWVRHFIQFPQGSRETTQSVLWIQAQSAFADVRSAPFKGMLTPDRYQTMPWRQRFDTDLLGFVGSFTWQPSNESQGTCTWHHRLAITPRSRPDTSRYEWLGYDDFLEHGTAEDDAGQSHAFVEHWHRIQPHPVAVWTLNQNRCQGQALMATTWAVIIYDQRASLPAGEQDWALTGFSASAWQKIGHTWKLQFGSHTYLGNEPIWTPHDLTLDRTAEDWQCQLQ